MKKTIWTDVVITVLGIAGLVLALVFYQQAFPEAAIQLKYSRSEIGALAQEKMEDAGEHVSDYHFALTFSESFLASVYLQQTLGVEATNKLLQSEPMPIYYWYARWYIPMQQEEYSMSLAPDGTLVGFFHTISEDSPGAALTQEEARMIAEEFLSLQQPWKNGVWEQVGASSGEKPGGRVDHTFTYRRVDFTAGESELRISVTVQGDQIGAYNYYLKIPESFGRHFSSQSNRAGFIDSVSTFIGYFGFLAAALLVLLRSLLRGGSINKGTVVIAVSVAGISLLASLNLLPLYRMGYSTTEDYSLFWINNITNIIVGAISIGILAGFLWMGGQSLSKLAWPMQDRVLPRGPDRLVALSRSTWRGLMMAGISIGYVVVFYLIAERVFGSWTPMDTSYSNLYATPFPFMGAIEVGFIPAMTEELMFRLVGVGLIYWAFKKRWLALLIPGVLWAFAHASYVRDPIYLRGIELSIAAIFIYGLFFLKFDLTTTIVGHFAFNAGLTALPMLFSRTPYYVLSGIIVIAVMVIPIIPGLFIQLQRKAKKLPAPPEPRIIPIDAKELAALPEADWSALAAQPGAIVLGLRAGERVIGAIAGSQQEGGAGRVDAIYIAPEWRRQYWGTRLAAALTEQMKSRGIEDITSEVKLKDKNLRSFWASQDWKAISQTLAHTSPQTLRQILAGGISAIKKRLAHK